MKLPQMKTVEMVECDACKEYHALADCEIVVIKIIKGKNCPLTKRNTHPVQEIKIQTGSVSPHAEPVPTTVFDKQKKYFTEEEDKYPVITPEAKKRKPSIPPNILSMMMDPGQADFEQRGDKIKRHV